MLRSKFVPLLLLYIASSELTIAMDIMEPPLKVLEHKQGKIPNRYGICSCSKYDNIDDCTNFYCVWEMEKKKCREFACDERPAENCLPMNQMLRLESSQILCALFGDKCHDPPDSCDEYNWKDFVPQNCKSNRCFWQEKNQKCADPLSNCSFDVEDCHGPLANDKQIYGFCSTDPETQDCKVILFSDPCETIGDRSACDGMMSNCFWHNEQCVANDCETRSTEDCDAFPTDIFKSCVARGDSCQNVPVEQAKEEECKPDSTKYWDHHLGICKSCNKKRWNSKESQDDSTRSIKSRQSIVINSKKSDVQGSLLSFASIGFLKIFSIVQFICLLIV